MKFRKYMKRSFDIISEKDQALILVESVRWCLKNIINKSSNFAACFGVYVQLFSWDHTKINMESPLKWFHVVSSGGRLNIKMSSYQYMDPHVKDKTVSRPSYL